MNWGLVKLHKVDKNSVDRRSQLFQTIVVYCENMAPAIGCTHPYLVVLYDRMSPPMRALQKMTGEDLTRELLLHYIVLVPAGTMDIAKKVEFQDVLVLCQ